MKKNLFFYIIAVAAFLMPARIQAQSDPMKILEEVDRVFNAPKDQSLTIKTIILDKRGKESVRELTMLQKGSDKRMIKFLSPADQKGIGFLSLPGDNLTLYMPAYGKTRKVGGHVKNTKFAGTDYTYEDMEAKRYCDKYIPVLIKNDNENWMLQLTPKPETRSDYQKLNMTVSKADYYPRKIEYFDKAGVMVKTLESSKIQKTGKYMIARQTTMKDLKSNTSTKMEITNIVYDSGMSDDFFTERYLIR